MPVPGPRTQHGPDEGYRNPDGELPLRFRLPEPRFVFDSGRSPGTMEENRRGNVLAAGQIRTLWQQTAQFFAAQAPFSWTANRPGWGGGANEQDGGFGITRALRYMARSVYLPGGTDDTRLSELHTLIPPRVRSKAVTIAAGSVRSRPTVRNRLTSFGSRVDPINEQVAGAEE